MVAVVVLEKAKEAPWSIRHTSASTMAAEMA
jgi:hypothetical protein